MAVLPTFDPQGRATDASQVAIAAGENMSSMMERAAESRRQAQQLAMQKEQWDFQKPIMQAKANADMQEFGAKMYAVKQTQDLRAQFNASVPQIMSEMDQIDRGSYLPPELDDDGNPLGPGEPDHAGAADAYDALAAKYARYSALPEGKQLIDSLQAKGLQRHADYVSQVSQQNTRALAALNNAALTDRAVLLGQLRLEGYGMQGQNKLDVVGAQNQGRQIVAETQNQGRQVRSETQDYIRLAGQYSVSAQKETDADVKAVLLQRANEYSLKAEQSLAPSTAASPLPTVSVNTSRPSDTPATAPAAPAASAPTPVYRVGTRVIQNGATYEFDGAHWNLVTTKDNGL